MFDFTGRMEALVADLVRRLPVFEHVRIDRLLVTVSRARRGGLSGTYARIFPLRFERGEGRTVRRQGGALHTYEMPPLVHDGRDILYIVTFLLPRFQNLPFETKIATVVHEIYHVGPECDGDIRRLPGKNFAHGHSREVYDRKMTEIAGAYLAAGGHEPFTDFLRESFRVLERRHGGVTGRRVAPPVPRLVATEPGPRRVRRTPGAAPGPRVLPDAPPIGLPTGTHEPLPLAAALHVPAAPTGQLLLPFVTRLPARRPGRRPAGT